MNNGAQVLRGSNNTTWNNTNNQSGLGQQQAQQQQQQISPLTRLLQISGTLQGRINQNGGTASLYNTGSGRNSFSQLFCLDDTLAEEQIKAQALIDGGYAANSVFNICINRNTGHAIYKTLRAAFDRFKTPRKHTPPEPTLASFIDEIDSNNALYQFIAINSSIQLSAEIANALMKGDEQLRTDMSKIQEIFYRVALDTVYMQYFDFLANHPEGTQIFYRLPSYIKEALLGLENNLFDMVLGRFTFINGTCPWRKGRLAEIQQRTVADNPLFGSSDTLDLGFSGNYNNPNDLFNQTNETPNDVRELQEYVRQKAAQNQQERYGTATVNHQQDNRDRAFGQTTPNGYDEPALSLENITRENRLKYNPEKWGVKVPNTEWWVFRPEHAVHFTRVLDMDDGIPFRMRDTRCVGTVALYRINWMEGTFNFRLVKHNLQAFDLMGSLISDPNKLLPFMYEEDGVHKTTFDPTILSTNKFVNDGKVIPVGEMKELEKEPDILVGNKPMKANQGNEHTINRLNVYTQTYDPKSKLDAFVLPMVITREWRMEPEVNLAKFYSNFGVMVHNNKHSYDDTAQVIRLIRGAYNECESEEFKGFIKPYITNVVNRWFIECRGYAETKKEVDESKEPLSYLRTNDIFADLDDLISYLRDHDAPTLRAFLDYRFNHFIRGGIEVLCSKEEVKTEYEEKYGKEEDPIMKAALIASGEKAIIIRRDTVFFNLIKAPAPRTLELITIKESATPELFATIRKAFSYTSKHFKETPQILIKFNRDEGNKVWVATPSDFDPESVYTLRTVSSGQTYCHPYPVCD